MHSLYVVSLRHHYHYYYYMHNIIRSLSHGHYLLKISRSQKYFVPLVSLNIIQNIQGKIQRIRLAEYSN